LRKRILDIVQEALRPPLKILFAIEGRRLGLAKYPQIRVTPPGPKALEVLDRDRKVLSPYNRPFCYPFVAHTARDCIVRDVDGNEYIDFNSGLVAMNVGHCHPKVVEAIRRQAGEFMHYSYTDFYYPHVVELAEKFLPKTPGKFEKKVYFGNSGAESIEAAIKVTKWHTGKHRFLAFIGAFHGRTIGALSLTSSKPVQMARFFPTMPGVTHVPYPYCYRCAFKMTYPGCDYYCVDFIDEMILHRYVPPEEVAAFFFEPVQGEGGYVVPPPEYFQRLKKLADKYGILLVADEVQTGMARSGKWFAIEHWNVEPDVLCTSKAMAAGLSIGATVSKAEIMDWEAGAHCTTLAANPVACAAAMAVIDVIEEERLWENAAKQGDYIQKRFRELQGGSEMIGDVRGKGLMIGVEFVKNRQTKQPAGREVDEVLQKCFKKGVLAISGGDSTIRIAPPLTITRELLDAGLEILSEAIAEVEAGR